MKITLGQLVAALVGLAALITTLVTAGMWLGSLQQRVNQLEQRDRYLHGIITVPDVH